MLTPSTGQAIAEVLSNVPQGPTPPARDFVPAIGLRTRIQPNDGGVVLCSSRGVDTSALHLCHRAFGCGPRRCAERYRESCDSRPLRRTSQYHVLPKDDAEAVVDIMRAAAGLPPLYGGHDDEGG